MDRKDHLFSVSLLLRYPSYRVTDGMVDHHAVAVWIPHIGGGRRGGNTEQSTHDDEIKDVRGSISLSSYHMASYSFPPQNGSARN